MTHDDMTHEGMSHDDALHDDTLYDDTGHSRGEITIDCASCLARPAACGDCIVSVLLGPPGAIGGEEQAAFAVLAGSGLVPPLRLVKGHEGVA